jgi:hypothetical protein
VIQPPSQTSGAIRGVIERLGMHAVQRGDRNAQAPGMCRAIASAARVEPPHSPGHNRRQAL